MSGARLRRWSPCNTPNCTGPVDPNKKRKPEYAGYCVICSTMLQQRKTKRNKREREKRI